MNLTEYDVVLILITLFGFLITVSTAVWKLRGSITGIQCTADLLKETVEELRHALRELQTDNRAAHNSFYGRIRELENRVTVLESQPYSCQKNCLTEKKEK